MKTDAVKGKEIKEAVREKYGKLAREISEGPTNEGCCGPSTSSSCCGPSRSASRCAASSARFYAEKEIADLPKSVTDISLGSGNPLSVADLKAGESVLDLGSGGGIDCMLASKAVGPKGRVIGLDMTGEMIELSRRNAEKAGAGNVEFRLGEMEAIPLPDASVDVIISNCVINLSPDKDAVFREAFRVLKPGGRMVVSDIVTKGELPDSVRGRMEAWAGCIAGALDEEDYMGKIQTAGFAEAQIMNQKAVGKCEGEGEKSPEPSGPQTAGRELDGVIHSVTVRAVKATLPNPGKENQACCSTPPK